MTDLPFTPSAPRFAAPRLMDEAEMDALRDAVIPCPDCAARGFVLREDHACPLCHDVCVIPRPGGPLSCSSN